MRSSCCRCPSPRSTCHHVTHTILLIGKASTGIVPPQLCIGYVGTRRSRWKASVYDSLATQVPLHRILQATVHSHVTTTPCETLFLSNLPASGWWSRSTDSSSPLASSSSSLSLAREIATRFAPFGPVEVSFPEQSHQALVRFQSTELATRALASLQWQHLLAADRVAELLAHGPNEEGARKTIRNAGERRIPLSFARSSTPSSTQQRPTKTTKEPIEDVISAALQSMTISDSSSGSSDVVSSTLPKLFDVVKRAMAFPALRHHLYSLVDSQPPTTATTTAPATTTTTPATTTVTTTSSSSS